jgi:hypothetical protein
MGSATRTAVGPLSGMPQWPQITQPDSLSPSAGKCFPRRAHSASWRSFRSSKLIAALTMSSATMRYPPSRLSHMPTASSSRTVVVSAAMPGTGHQAPGRPTSPRP